MPKIVKIVGYKEKELEDLNYPAAKDVIIKAMNDIKEKYPIGLITTIVPGTYPFGWGFSVRIRCGTCYIENAKVDFVNIVPATEREQFLYHIYGEFNINTKD